MMRITYLLVLVGALLSTAAPARASDDVRRDSLSQLSESIEAIVKRVSPSVVQVVVTGLGEVDDRSRDADLVVERQRTVASGVIVDSNGFIVTNAHVLKGAQHVEVVMPLAAAAEATRSSPAESREDAREARVVGMAPEMDLALLKIDADGLPALAFADYGHLRQGQLVFAFGSPEGLRNSVTMGVVSAVARQADVDDPMVYIQTDAPINPGNSGGPLVNANGDVVGINTFILSESGGSEGLGFAIPSALVSAVYPQLREHGRLRRGQMGVRFQTITRELARGLGLARDRGVIVCDVLPGSSAEAAGVQVEDIVTSVNGRPVEGLFQLMLDSLSYRTSAPLTLNVLRGEGDLTLRVPVTESSSDAEHALDRIDAEDGLVRRLGVFGVTLEGKSPTLAQDLRIPHGVLVAARVKNRRVDVPLATGDVIHTVNGVAVSNVRDLRALIGRFEARSAVVLQVERHGGLSFVTFHLD